MWNTMQNAAKLIICIHTIILVSTIAPVTSKVAPLCGERIAFALSHRHRQDRYGCRQRLNVREFSQYFPSRARRCNNFQGHPTRTKLFTNTNPTSSSPDIIDQNNMHYNTTSIANQIFRLPTSEHLETIQERQLHHPLQPNQVFCISTSLCKYGHPQAFGFHPTNGPKLVSGLFRLSCPLLCQAIDEYEGEGGVRQMSDWLRSKEINDAKHHAKHHDDSWKRDGYERANDAQKNIRMELAKDDTDKIISRMGEYNAQKFLESGVAGIPPSQTYNVKCVHAHVADHLCRCPPSSTSSDATTIGEEGGNIIGKHALQILEKQGVPIMGNDVCWQQCNAKNCGGEQQPQSSSSEWNYVPKKNRQGLRSTRRRRKEQSK